VLEIRAFRELQGQRKGVHIHFFLRVLEVSTREPQDRAAAVPRLQQMQEELIAPQSHDAFERLHSRWVSRCVYNGFNAGDLGNS
jgi:hypothetical protein